MRTSKHSSPVDVGRIILAMITILAIAGTLSACGRYGSPVRSAPVEAEVDPGSEPGPASDVMESESEDSAAEKESDHEDEDEDDLIE